MGLSIYKQKGRFALLLQMKYLYSFNFYLKETEKGSFLSAFSGKLLIVEPFYFSFYFYYKSGHASDFYLKISVN